MDEIIKAVIDRTGIPEDKARQAVDVVISQLQKRLPEPVASQLKSHLSGDKAGQSGAEKAARGLGGMLPK